MPGKRVSFSAAPAAREGVSPYDRLLLAAVERSICEKMHHGKFMIFNIPAMVGFYVVHDRSRLAKLLISRQTLQLSMGDPSTASIHAIPGYLTSVLVKRRQAA